MPGVSTDKPASLLSVEASEFGFILSNRTVELLAREIAGLGRSGAVGTQSRGQEQHQLLLLSRRQPGGGVLYFNQRAHTMNGGQYGDEGQSASCSSTAEGVQLTLSGVASPDVGIPPLDYAEVGPRITRISRMRKGS